MNKYIFLCKAFIACMLFFCPTSNVQAEFIPREYKGSLWITVPEINPQNYGVYYFRKFLYLKEQPDKVPIKVSADGRYMLYVNGTLVSQGPAKSDLKHWNYERIDIAPFLKSGNNVVAARVFNEGKFHAESHLSKYTAFLIAGENENAQQWDTNSTWSCVQDHAYTPLPTVWTGYFAVSPGETVDMHLQVTDWKEHTCNLSSWKQAKAFAVPRYNNSVVPYGTASTWQLQPSPLPQMEMKMQRIKSVRKSTISLPDAFLKGNSPVTIPANTVTTILLDQQQVTNAFLTLNLSKGKNAKISIAYQEALYKKTDNPERSDMGEPVYKKSNRNDIEGMFIGGRKDSVICSGAEVQSYTTLTWRTYRYIQLNIQTSEDSLIIKDIYGTFTGYPFRLASTLDTQDKELQKIIDIGWHTARLCANETYMDCPYYEQLQYWGDTRIQALISLYNTRDDRLVKNFLNQADISRQPEGITLSRYPSTSDQIIPAYSLAYILSLHDYLMYGYDKNFVARKLSGVRQILEYYHQYQLEDGRVKGLPWWNFSDWVEDEGWAAGVAPSGKDGCSATTDLFLLLAYQAAASLEKHSGMEVYRNLYEQRAEQIKKAVISKYWNNDKHLFADDAEHKYYSQHTNSLAILAHVIEGEGALLLARHIADNHDISQASVYFKFYLDEALTLAGLGDEYLSRLDIYRKNISMGLTTWAETSNLETTRSDCHAWGSSPNIEVYRTILGIESDGPEFSKVKITPHLGSISEIGGSIPWRKGDIKVKYTLSGKHLKAAILLPEGLSGKFIWNNKEYAIHSGNNLLNL